MKSGVEALGSAKHGLNGAGYVGSQECSLV